MNYKEFFRNTALKGLYIGVVWYALNFVLMYVLSKVINYRYPFIVLIAIVQIVTIIPSYGFVDIIVNRWKTSKRIKAIVIGLSVLVAVGIIAYDLASLFVVST